MHLPAQWLQRTSWQLSLMCPLCLMSSRKTGGHKRVPVSPEGGTLFLMGISNAAERGWARKAWQNLWLSHKCPSVISQDQKQKQTLPSTSRKLVYTKSAPFWVFVSVHWKQKTYFPSLASVIQGDCLNILCRLRVLYKQAIQNKNL